MPYLRVRDAASAIKFYKKVFGATENYRLKMAGKIGHAELTVGGAVVMLSDEFPDSKAVGPETLKGTSVQLAAYVDNADKVVAKAIKAGAKLLREVGDQFYGDRMGQIEDPFGHVWSINTRLVKVDPKEMQRRLNAMMSGDMEPGRKPARKSAGRKASSKAATVRAKPAKATASGTKTKVVRSAKSAKSAQSAKPAKSARATKAAGRQNSPQKSAPQKASPRKTSAKPASTRKAPARKAMTRKPAARRKSAGN